MFKLLIGLILRVGGAPITAAPTSAQALDERAPVYLALGDSIAVGDGASNPKESGYVPLVRSLLQGSIPCQRGGDPPCSELQLLNLAQGFATTTTLQETQLPRALEMIERRNTDHDPGNNVIAITIDIGGFDTMVRVFRVCATGSLDQCGRAIEQTLSGVGQNLTTILSQLRTAAGPDTRIAVMTYFNSLMACDLQDVAGRAEVVLEGTGHTPGLNDVIRLAAEYASVEVADAYSLLGANDLIGGIDCLHPNDAGHRKIAGAFVSVLAPESA